MSNVGNKNSLPFEGTNFVRFTEGTDFAGLYGKVNEDGYLNALGFIERDSVCTQAFLDTLGVEGYDWNASKGASFGAPSTYTADFKARVELLNDDEAQELLATAPVVPEHSHGEEAETGLVVVTVLIWVAIAIIMMVCIFMYCKMKMKKDQQIGHTRA